MKKIVFSLLLVFLVGACGKPQATQPSPPPSPATAVIAPVSGPFSSQELQEFVALNPIDTHTHIYQSSPGFFAMFDRLNLHILDITVVVDNDKTRATWTNFSGARKAAWGVVHNSAGHASLCTTFDPYKFNQPNFSKNAVREINRDFAQGAVAVKIWKNIGMEIKDVKGNYILPDNPVFEPIYRDIAAHHKTLIAHVADPNTIWEPPNPTSPDYSYYMEHPEWYMYNKSHAASKEQILLARDRLLEENPNLRVVGAHLGSMEANFSQLAQHLDRYPNFAVDLAARMPYMMLQPRADIISFITKYQDRLIYATDNEFFPKDDAQKTINVWEEQYADDWRFLATNDTLVEQSSGRKVQGLALPQPVLRKLYHDNAVKWFPGILGNSH